MEWAETLGQICIYWKQIHKKCSVSGASANKINSVKNTKNNFISIIIVSVFLK